MREIIFRGRRVDNGEWAYGYLVEATNVITDKKETFIFEQDATYFTHGEFACSFEVKPETVGQYTGVIDKNGKKVFEGDVVEYAGSCGEIVFVERRGAFMSRERDMYCEWLSNLPQYGTGIVEIIGNIYDNKEILEGKE